MGVAVTPALGAVPGDGVAVPATTTKAAATAAATRGGDGVPTTVADLAAHVARLRAEITALVSREPDVDGATGPALHAELRTAAGQLHAYAARVLARVEADGRWAAGPARTFPDWMARTALASVSSVRRDVTLGRALDESLPATARAVACGEVTVEHAEVLARVAATSERRRAALASGDAQLNESALLDKAARMPLDRYRREVARWATQVDNATAEAEHEVACAKEYLTLSRRPDGVALQGFLTVEHATVVATALRAVAGVPSEGDDRSREQRQAAALADGARLILDRGLTGNGQQVRPHLLVHVPLETLATLEAHGATDPERFDGLDPARLQDGEPVTPSTLARLACVGELSRVVFGADRAPLDVGRAKRTYSGAQRLAVIARDESCRFPGCGAPLALGEVHHVRSWSSGGPTSVENGVLLCWFHHAFVHRRAIRIARVGAAWEFCRADGVRIEGPWVRDAGVVSDGGGGHGGGGGRGHGGGGGGGRGHGGGGGGGDHGGGGGGHGGGGRGDHDGGGDHGGGGGSRASGGRSGDAVSTSPGPAPSRWGRPPGQRASRDGHVPPAGRPAPSHAQLPLPV